MSDALAWNGATVRVDYITEAEFERILSHRACKQCGRWLPLERYYASGHGNGRRWTCIDCLHHVDTQKRRARKASVRHPRYNARGDVWCNRCQRYLGREEFRRHPQRPHTLWSYCKACTREKDRERYAKRTSTLAGALEDQRKRLDRKHRRQLSIRMKRLHFVQDTIRQLRRRGLTKAEICQLGGFSLSSLWNWEKQTDPLERRITGNVERRFGILLEAAIQVLPPPAKGAPLAYKRTRPHPDLPHLMAIVEPQLAQYPIRSSWINGKRDHLRKGAT